MIRHILFDLDDTLYSVRYGIDNMLLDRIREFVTSYLSLPWEECEGERREAMKRYGTTLEWLTCEKGLTDPDSYFACMHPENEVDCLPPDPALRRFLEDLPCACSVLTNSPLFHAERVIKKLELEGVFRHIFDIKSNGFKGKPHASAFQKALDTLGLKPDEAFFIDDYPRYVKGYIQMGGRGILLDETDAHKNYPHEKIKDLKELVRFFT